MKPSEAAELLSVCSAFDLRKIGDADAIAWSLALGDVTLAESSSAVVTHYATATERVMPAHIIAIVRKQRRKILAEAGHPPFPPGLPWPAEQRWRRAWIARLATGSQPAAAQDLADRELGITRDAAPQVTAPPQVQTALNRFTAARRITR